MRFVKIRRRGEVIPVIIRSDVIMAFASNPDIDEEGFVKIYLWSGLPSIDVKLGETDADAVEELKRITAFMLDDNYHPEPDLNILEVFEFGVVDLAG